MLRNWTQRFAAWIQGQRVSVKSRQKRSRTQYAGSRVGALVSRLEELESRRLLTNLVSVHVAGGAVNLFDISGPQATTGDNFSVSYTGNQVVLTGTNGTSFKVGNQTLTTFTANVSSPISIAMWLDSKANTVTVTGDGTANLTSFHAFLGASHQNNSLTLTKVIADTVNVFGGSHDDSVTLNQSTVHGNLTAILGFSSGDKLDLETTTVGGHVFDYVGQLVMNHSTISGRLFDVELGKNSTYTSTDTTYTGEVLVLMGRDGIINYLGSVDGANHTHSKVTFIGRAGHNAQISQGNGSIINDIPAHLIHTDERVAPNAAKAPTVNAVIASTSTPTITGTFDSVNSKKLSVAVAGNTYTLGTSPELTSPSAGQWSLNLANSALPTTSPTLTATATATDQFGDAIGGSGTVANQQASISKYVTAQNLTAIKTASGLNYAITTAGSGALPTAGQTLTVNYSGFLLNADGTQGTEFDSNIDAQFNHVTPFSFKLGTGAVIKGWDEAFALLKVGTAATLLIPSSIAYGAGGSGSSIPPNSVLIFKVVLVSAA